MPGHSELSIIVVIEQWQQMTRALLYVKGVQRFWEEERPPHLKSCHCSKVVLNEYQAVAAAAIVANAKAITRTVDVPMQQGFENCKNCSRNTKTSKAMKDKVMELVFLLVNPGFCKCKCLIVVLWYVSVFRWLTLLINVSLRHKPTYIGCVVSRFYLVLILFFVNKIFDDTSKSI